MWVAVIPVFNEALSIYNVITSVVKSGVDHVVLVANGCTDNSCLQAIRAGTDHILHIIEFSEPLGVDIPRAVGAAFAQRLNPAGIIFVDGDMKGDIIAALMDLRKGIENGLDMALTNCYPFIYQRSALACSVLKERETLNRKLGLFNKLGLASPSHGPHAVSARFLFSVPLKTIAIPPLSLVIAVQNRLAVGVATAIPHLLLGSIRRSNQHADLIAQTIIGDCRQAMAYLEGTSLDKILENTDDPVGYRPQRRFDLLDNYLKSLM